MARRVGVFLLILAAASTVALLPGPAAHSVTDRWSAWGPITGSSNNYVSQLQQRSAGFPSATVATDSRSNVQIPGGTSSFMSAATPPGAKYGSSLGSPYLVLRPKADNATSPSTTTYAFDDPTPDTGWGFVLGDIDADAVRVRATDAGGNPVSSAEIDGWFQGAFNAVGATDVPTWDAASSTLTGTWPRPTPRARPAGSSPTSG